MKLLIPFLFFYQLDIFSHSEFLSLANQIQGRWEMQTSKGKLTEQWIKVNDSLYQSKSYHFHGSDSTLQETVELRFSKGSITYTPVVSGQNDGKPVVFALVKISENSFVFENKDHDFPQRIVYYPGNHSLKVVISGEVDRVEREMVFLFERKFD